MTTKRPILKEAGSLYLALVVAAGISVVLHSLYSLAARPLGYQWFVLAGLTLLSGSFTVRIPTIPARLSVSETFVFAATLLFGPAAATAIVVLDSLVISLWLRRTSRSASRVLFNMAAPAIAIWVASHVFFSVASVEPLYLSPKPILSLVAPLLLMALLYFLLNSWLIAGAIGFEKRVSPFRIWRDNFLWLSLNYFSGASVAILLLPYLQNEQRAFIRIASILLPLLVISYLTFKTALGRVDDANEHLSELNKLYLSTIETLAMAIDAKDQITHGHIRRVQQYAVGLAKRLGVTDENQIRAIEAASLLHDMGKLAVPEYILNKPGKLTPAEFDKMKLHASVGADILSAIQFPYPVVPIVRHHHENWDGSGYPDGLNGSEIPIGARILSVVDCFDALTSDRPYRPRLTDAEALKILRERRGSMYDPLVVDTFLAVHPEIIPALEVDNIESQAVALSAISRERDSAEPKAILGNGLDDIAASTEEMVVLFELARNLAGQVTFADICEIVAKHLRRVVPASTCVLYVYDPIVDELTSVHAVGEHAEHFIGLRIPRGQRLTGWVAANRQTILNSDPLLDLGEVARRLKPRLNTCLSTPILQVDDLIGVLSVYSAHRDSFTDDHRRIMEVVARQISLSVKNVIAADSSVREEHRRSSGEQPHLRVVDADSAESFDLQPLSIALLMLRRSGRIPADGSETFRIRHIAESVRRALRSADVLFRLSEDEFLILLSQTNTDNARYVAQRIATEVRRQKATLVNGYSAPVSMTVGVATAPLDGTDIQTLIVAARRRAEPLETLASSATSIH